MVLPLWWYDAPFYIWKAKASGLYATLTSISANQRSSHAYMISHDSLWRPLATALHRPSPRNPRHSVVNSKKSFITSPCVQAEFLDDIGETDNVVSGRRSKHGADRRHGSQVQSISLMQRGQGTVIRNKQSSSQSPARPRSAQNSKTTPATSPDATAAAELRAAAKLEPAAEREAALRKLQSITSKFNTLRKGASQLVSKYAHLKYQYIADELSQGTVAIGSWENELHEIALIARTRLESERVRLRLEESRRQVEESLSMAHEVLLMIEKEVNELTEPRLSARHRVEAYMAPLNEITKINKNMSSLCYEIKYHLLAMAASIRLFLERVPSLRSRLWPIYWKLVFERKNFRKIVHYYRHYYILRNIYQYYGESWPFMLFIGPGDRYTINRRMRRHRLKVIKFERKRDRLQAPGKDPLLIAPKPGVAARLSDHYQLDYAEHVEKFYFPGPKALCHPLLDLHKRQLDVMAPFLLARDMGGNMGHIIGALMERISGPLGSILNRKEKEEHQETLKRYSAVMRDLRSHHITVSLQIWQLNWIRLKAEDKLVTLGMPNIDMGRGERLTENRTLFRQWAERMRGAHIATGEIISLGSDRMSRHRRVADMPKSQGRTRALPRQRILGRPKAPAFKSRSRTSAPDHGHPTKPLDPRKARRSRQRNVSTVPALGSNTVKYASDFGPLSKALLPGHGTSAKLPATGPWKARYTGRAFDDTENAPTLGIPEEGKSPTPWTYADLQRKARETLIAAVNKQDEVRDQRSGLQGKEWEMLVAAVNHDIHNPKPANKKRLPHKASAKSRRVFGAKSQQRSDLLAVKIKQEQEQEDHSNSKVLGEAETSHNMAPKPRGVADTGGFPEEELVTPTKGLKGLDILGPLGSTGPSQTVSPGRRHTINTKAQPKEELAPIGDPNGLDILGPITWADDSRDMAETDAWPTEGLVTPIKEERYVSNPRPTAKTGTSRRMAPKPKIPVGHLRRGRLAVKHRIPRSTFK